MLALAMMMLAVDVQTPAERTVTWASIEGKSTADLARMFLPSETAGTIVESKIGRLWAPGQSYNLSFWTAARPVGSMFCGRVRHSLDLKGVDPMAPWSEATPPETELKVSELRRYDIIATSYPDEATEAGCAEAKGYIAPRPEEREAAIAEVRRLTWAMGLAKSPGELPFEVTCREDDEATDKRCTDPRAALSQLHLDSMFRVEFNTGRYEQVPGMSPGIIRQLPPTPERPAVATIWFGPGGSDALSWKATLEMKGNRLAAVHLGRTTVIYH